jgi:hypothetical protein
MWSGEHRMVVGTDPGLEIKLVCECGWSASFGFSPYPSQLIQGEFDHLRDAVGGLTGNGPDGDRIAAQG